MVGSAFTVEQNYNDAKNLLEPWLGGSKHEATVVANLWPRC